MIRLDFTAHSVVAVCDQCPWRTLALDRLGAWRAAADHEKTLHPGTVQAQKALSERLHRHDRRCSVSRVETHREDKAHGNR